MNNDSKTDTHDVFRRHFEAQFKPIKKRKQQAISTGTIPSPVTEDFSEWSGLSEAEREQPSCSLECPLWLNSTGDDVEVVDYTKTTEPKLKGSRAERKAFMVAACCT